MHIQTSPDPELTDLVVQDLMIPRLKEWDVELIQGLFDDHDVEEIVKTYVVDTIIWNYTPNGQYSMKSGYRVAVDRLCGKGYIFQVDWKPFGISLILLNCGHRILAML